MDDNAKSARGPAPGSQRPTVTPGEASQSTAGGSFTGFDWLDTPALRKWFAQWLGEVWLRLYDRSLRSLVGRMPRGRYARAVTGMKKALVKLSRRLPMLTTREQLCRLDAQARRFDLSTTQEIIAVELHYYLTSTKRPADAAAFRASPWCNFHALESELLSRLGDDLSQQFYPADPDLKVAVQRVVQNLLSEEPVDEWSVEAKRLLIACTHLVHLVSTCDALSEDAVIGVEARKVRVLLEQFEAQVGERLEQLASGPSTFRHSPRTRDYQRKLRRSVVRICRGRMGARRAAEFLVRLLRDDWPRPRIGEPVELDDVLSDDCRARLVRGFIERPPVASKAEATALSRLLHAVVFRPSLRLSLLRLAADAEQRHKGWLHLRNVLERILAHVTREPSEAEKFRDFERRNVPFMRGLSRAQRKRLLPELGHDPDPSVRDLTIKERLCLASRQKNFKRPPEFAAGKSSAEVAYRRAMNAVRDEMA